MLIQKDECVLEWRLEDVLRTGWIQGWRQWVIVSQGSTRLGNPHNVLKQPSSREKALGVKIFGACTNDGAHSMESDPAAMTCIFSNAEICPRTQVRLNALSKQVFWTLHSLNIADRHGTS